MNYIEMSNNQSYQKLNIVGKLFVFQGFTFMMLIFTYLPIFFLSMLDPASYNNFNYQIVGIPIQLVELFIRFIDYILFIFSLSFIIVSLNNFHYKDDSERAKGKNVKILFIIWLTTSIIPMIVLVISTFGLLPSNLVIIQRFYFFNAIFGYIFIAIITFASIGLILVLKRDLENKGIDLSANQNAILWIFALRALLLFILNNILNISLINQITSNFGFVYLINAISLAGSVTILILTGLVLIKVSEKVLHGLSPDSLNRYRILPTGNFSGSYSGYQEPKAQSYLEDESFTLCKSCNNQVENGQKYCTACGEKM